MRLAAWCLFVVFSVAGLGACSDSPAATGTPGTGGTSADDTFPCGSTARCQKNAQYCFSESWNGTSKIPAQCRSLPAGCTTCACARPDAAAASMMCKTPSFLECTDGMTPLDDQTSSPTLNVFCSIA